MSSNAVLMQSRHRATFDTDDSTGAKNQDHRLEEVGTCSRNIINCLQGKDLQGIPLTLKTRINLLHFSLDGLASPTVSK